MTVLDIVATTNYDLRISIHDIAKGGLRRARLSEPVIETKHHRDLEPWENCHVVLIEPYDHCLSVFINTDDENLSDFPS